MPVHRGVDLKGPFYQWGTHGKKYHYVVGNVMSRERAKRKAELQGRATYAHGYKK